MVLIIYLFNVIWNIDFFKVNEFKLVFFFKIKMENGGCGYGNVFVIIVENLTIENLRVQ